MEAPPFERLNRKESPMKKILIGVVVVIVLAREFLVTGVRGYVESLGLEFPA